MGCVAYQKGFTADMKNIYNAPNKEVAATELIMIDLWLIIIASLNTLLLFLLNKKFPYNSDGEEKRKLFSLHIDDGLAFINTFIKR